MSTLPTMTSFERAVDTPTKYFRHLHHLRLRVVDGRAVVRRTYSAAEAEVEWEGRNYLLFMPFRREALSHIEQFDLQMASVEAPFICRHRIFHNEMLVPQMGGEASYVDIILQELPEGMSLVEAQRYYSVAELSHKLYRLERDMAAVGFLHNNLSPYNIILDDGGNLRLVRYWYADFSTSRYDDFEALIASLAEPQTPLRLLNDTLATYATPSPTPQPRIKDGMSRIFRNGKVGFADEDGVEVIPPIYCYADDFEEGRAIVSNESMKMGVIDKSGNIVVPLIYDDISFDVEQALFFACKGKMLCVLDYCGEELSQRQSLSVAATTP